MFVFRMLFELCLLMIENYMSPTTLRQKTVTYYIISDSRDNDSNRRGKINGFYKYENIESATDSVKT